MQIHFPQRLLRIKAETPEVAEDWEKALQQANMREVHQQEQQNTKASTPKVGDLAMHAALV